jgi:hypothetical protein
LRYFFLLKLEFESMMGFYLKKCLQLKKHDFIKTIKICINKKIKFRLKIFPTYFKLLIFFNKTLV